jgi:hypothetical protein
MTGFGGKKAARLRQLNIARRLGQFPVMCCLEQYRVSAQNTQPHRIPLGTILETMEDLDRK